MLLVKILFNKSMILSLSVCLLIMPLAQTKKAEAASFVEKLLYSAAAVSLITAYYNNVNDKGQKESLASTQKRTGVYDNEEAKQRINLIENRLKTSGLIRANYAIYPNPKKEFNAFCTLGHVISINKGTLDSLDDDELAVVISHEIGHGEEKHVVTGITKGISLGFAVDLFLANNQNNTSYILSTIGSNYINNEMFTMGQEWEADNLGFDYAVAAGFNPGGAAAAMVKMRSIYGELHHEGLAKVVNPNNHPKASDRVNNFSTKLTTYSNNHVRVKNDKTIMIDDQEVLTPVKTNNYLAEERTYIIAGNLARAYHNIDIGTAIVGEDGAVYIGNQKISNLVENDISAEELSNRINKINNKQF
ncbi:MAG: loiP [Firmicutes bacterium]|nr:loiP [Bacillota bacterium]